MYIVTQPSNGHVTRPMTLAEAADHVMSYDGHEYDIRPSADGVGYELWLSCHSRNSTCWKGLTKSVIFSLRDDLAQATEEIFVQVLRHATWWHGQYAYTEKEYTRMIAEFAADEAAAADAD